MIGVPAAASSWLLCPVRADQNWRVAASTRRPLFSAVTAEPAWHRRLRRQRQAARVLLAVQRARAQATSHHGYGGGMATTQRTDDVLPGPKRPCWGCPCGEANNWASRLCCKGCAKQAPRRIAAAARAAAEKRFAGVALPASGIGSSPSPSSQRAKRALEYRYEAQEKRLRALEAELKRTGSAGPAPAALAAAGTRESSDRAASQRPRRRPGRL